MPLHLLHHKSWHVYSADNIAKVQADEAAAAAAEAAEATASASARLESLREASTPGITPKPPTTPAETTITPAVSRPAAEVDHINKLGLTTAAGHINLFPAPPRAPNAPHPEVEAERKAAAAKFDAQFNSSLGRPGEAKPWYVVQQAEDEQEQIAGRKQRVQQRRKDLEDPMAAMQEGLRLTKEVEEIKGRQVEESRRRERDVSRDLHGGRRDEDGERRRRRRTDGDDGREKRRRSRSRNRRRSASPDRKHRRQNRSGGRKRSASPGTRRDPREHRHGESRRHRSSRRKEHEDDREDYTKLQERKEREKYGDDGSAAWKPAPGGRYSSQFGIGDVRQQ